MLTRKTPPLFARTGDFFGPNDMNDAFFRSKNRKNPNKMKKTVGIFTAILTIL